MKQNKAISKTIQKVIANQKQMRATKIAQVEWTSRTNKKI